MPCSLVDEYATYSMKIEHFFFFFLTCTVYHTAQNHIPEDYRFLCQAPLLVRTVSSVTVKCLVS